MKTYHSKVTDNPVGNIPHVTCVIMISLKADLPTILQELHPEY
jgi:hypothetical protein